MSKELNKDEVIRNKKKSIKALNKMLESFINDTSEKHLKKANLIFYWLNSYTSYLQNEESFSPSRLIRYKRGSVVRVNFGFNVGKELGGLHYAVVLDNDNKRNADVLTIIPLSSTDEKTVHERNVDLGSELYKKISSKQESLLEQADKELSELKSLANALKTASDALYDLNATCDENINEKIQKIEQTRNECSSKQQQLEKRIAMLTKNGIEIKKLKFGSMAVVNQITTISKQRIYAPKYSEDFLYGVKLSPSAMDRINNKVKELYIFD